MGSNLRIVICGLSITSAWGNGHATTYRGLIRELAKRGHDVLFLERNVPWYASNRDMTEFPFCTVRLYSSLTELRDRFTEEIRHADVVMVGSYVPQGAQVGKWVLENASNLTAFYDIDTPVTLGRIRRNDIEYLTREQISQYGLYLSFTGGLTLRHLEHRYGARCARALYCSVDPDQYSPRTTKMEFDLGYLGTFSPDRQQALDELLLQPAWRWQQAAFVVAGAQYPLTIQWPQNVMRIEHVVPSRHSQFYGQQRFTLNLTRSDMRRAGYCPSVRLFEAAACGTPIISDYWDGLGMFFEIGSEIIVAQDANEVLHILKTTSEQERLEIARRARGRVLSEHTAAQRSAQLEQYLQEAATTHQRGKQLAG